MSVTVEPLSEADVLSEVAPLLPNRDRATAATGAEHQHATPQQEICSSRSSSSSTLTPSNPKKKAGTILVLVLICLLVCILDFGTHAAIAPQTKLFEDIVCQKYYSEDGVGGGYRGLGGDDRRCKAEPVQSELALLLGWKDTFDTIPGVALSIPFGVVADRWGRRPVLILGVAGIVLSETWLRVVCWFPSILPLRLVWLSAVMLLMGGGSPVASTILLTMIADVTSEAQRMTALSIVYASVMISEIFAVPAGAALTENNAWTAYIVAWFIIVAGSVITLALPETLPPPEDAGSGSAAENQSADHVSVLSHSSIGKELKHRVFGELGQFYESTRVIWTKPNVGLLCLMFFVAVTGRQSMIFLVIYASKKYEWSIAEASYLYPVRSTISLVILLCVLPLLTKLFMGKFRMRAATKDLLLSQVSAAVMVAGMLIIAFAEARWFLVSGVLVFALGSGFPLTVRSLVTSLVEPRHFATLYAVISVVQSTGVVLAGPALAGALHWGLVLGPPWLGMPFLVAAVLYLVALLCLSCVRLEKPGNGVGAESAGAGEEEIG